MNKNKWQLLLTFMENGMVLENPNHVFGEDNDRGGRFEKVIEMDENEDESLSESRLIKSLIHNIIDYFGLHQATSKHSKFNIAFGIIDTK